MFFLAIFHVVGEHFPKNVSACPALHDVKGDEIIVVGVLFYFCWILYFLLMLVECMFQDVDRRRERSVERRRSSSPPSYEQVMAGRNV